MSTRFKRIIVILIVVGLLMTGIASVFGQSNSDQAEKAQLETKLKEIEAAILKGERDLTLTQAEKERYQYEISTSKRIDQPGSK